MVTPKGSMSTERETLQVSVLPYRCSICWLLRAPDKHFSHTLNSLGRWPQPASSFRSAQAATLLEFHVPLTNCFVHRWFCAVHGPKPLLICFFLPCLSWLLRSRVRKFWRDLWITLYMTVPYISNSQLSFLILQSTAVHWIRGSGGSSHSSRHPPIVKAKT